MKTATRYFLLVTLIIISYCVPANCSASTVDDEVQHQWLGKRIAEAHSIRVGMTRADLLKLFDDHINPQSKPSNRYPLKTCPWLYVIVKFDNENIIPAGRASKSSQVANEALIIRDISLLHFAKANSSNIVTSEEKAHYKWLDDCNREALSVKWGMTRADLLKVFDEDGGLCCFNRYILKKCYYFQVEVKFYNEENLPKDKFEYSKADNEALRIRQISEPYITLVNSN